MTRDASEELRAGSHEPSPGVSPWAPAFRLLGLQVLRWRYGIVAFAIAGAVIGSATKVMTPASNFATAQILFKPEGVKVFSNDLTPERYDANAQIDFVESQMGVLLSERVLSRALAHECALGAGDPAADTPAKEKPPPAGFLRLCPDPSGAAETSKGVDALRRMVAIRRAERSFLVDVTATTNSTGFSAQLANAIVNAYIDEEASERAKSSNRIAAEIHGRLDTLRRDLEAAEAKALVYRNDKNLVEVGDKLIVELRLADLNGALNAAQANVERARARLSELESAPLTSASLAGADDEADSRALVVMLDRQAQAASDLAPLAARLGARHPDLIRARSRLAEANRAVGAELAAIRASVRGALNRAVGERDNLARQVNQLSAEVTSARESQIALRALEQTVDADRTLVETFETRAQEAEQFGKIDPTDLRVASLARAPEPHSLLFGRLAWGGLGFAIFAVLAVSILALEVVLRRDLFMGDSPSQADRQAWREDEQGREAPSATGADPPKPARRRAPAPLQRYA